MAKSDKEKMMWMKMSKDFPSQYKLRALVNRKKDGHGLNGREIFAIAIFMMCESIAYKGQLRYSETRPYMPELLADVLCFPCKDVIKTIQVLTELEILKTMDDGTMFFECVADNFCETSKGAERIRKIRENKNGGGTNVPNVYPKCTEHEPNNSINRTPMRASRESMEIKNKDIKKSPTEVGEKENGLTPVIEAVANFASEEIHHETVFEDGGCGASVGFGSISKFNANRTRVTKEEVAEYIRFANEQCNTMVTPEQEADFWDYIVMRNSDPQKRIVTKGSIGRTLKAFLDIRKREDKKAEREAKERSKSAIGHHLTSEEIAVDMASQPSEEEQERLEEEQVRKDAEERRRASELIAQGRYDEL